MYLGISCGVPPAGINTSVASNSLFYEDSYNYTCLDGFVTNDPVTTECLANGTFSLDNPPSCTSQYEIFYHWAYTTRVPLIMYQKLFSNGYTMVKLIFYGHRVELYIISFTAKVQTLFFCNKLITSIAWMNVRLIIWSKLRV